MSHLYSRLSVCCRLQNLRVGFKFIYSDVKSAYGKRSHDLSYIIIFKRYRNRKYKGYLTVFSHNMHWWKHISYAAKFRHNIRQGKPSKHYILLNPKWKLVSQQVIKGLFVDIIISYIYNDRSSGFFLLFFLNNISIN